MKNTIMILAHKYNDILFSIETKEFKNSEFKKLIIFKLPHNKLEDYPFLNKFNEVYIFEYDKDNVKKNILRFFYYVFKQKNKLKSDILFISNPYLLYNKIFYKIVSPSEVVLVEDGLMNYVVSHKKAPKLKQLFQKIMGVDDLSLLENTKKTYLSIPDKATLFGGKKYKLSLSTEISRDLSDVLNILKGKKLFIGQNLYPNFCSENDYYKYVEEIVFKYNIDYYVPHAYEKYNNQLDGFPVFFVKKYTFEYMAQFISFNIYSFGSSLLLSTKIVNPKIVSNLVKLDCFSPFYTEDLINICDNIIEIGKIG